MKPATSAAYRSDIDGLRAVAVLPVLFFHAELTGFSGGYVGVDIFFVISGFLITGILHREMSCGTFSLLRFYERRVRRIIPALIAMIAVVGVVATVLLLPADLGAYGRSAIGALLSVSNIVFMLETGYFQTEADLKPLLHTWSLGVEEQFYLFFPLFLMAVHAWWRRALLPIVYLALGLSLLACVLLTMHLPSWAFYLAPTRAWEFLLGAIVALGGVPAIRSSALKEALCAAGLACIALAVVLFDASTPFPGIAAALPAIGAAAIVHAGHQTVVGNLLSTRPLVFVGLISYSLYLWHWPVLVFARYVLIRPLTAPEAIGLLLAAAVMAVLSWRFVERPFRDGSALPRRSRLFVTAGAATLASVVAGAVLMTGLPSRAGPEAAAVAAAGADRTAYRDRCLHLPVAELRAGRPCMLGQKKDASVLLWGDSHADAISPALDRLARQGDAAVFNASHISCPPALGIEVYVNGASKDCRAWNDAVAELAALPEIETVVLVARWAAYAHGRRNADDQSWIDGSGADNRTSVLIGLERSLRLVSGKKVFLVLSVPEVQFDVPSALARTTWFGLGKDRRIGPEKEEHLLRQAIVTHDIRRLAAKYGATVIDPAARMCSDRCAVEENGRPLYYDDHHLSTYGAQRLAPLFEAVI